MTSQNAPLFSEGGVVQVIISSRSCVRTIYVKESGLIVWIEKIFLGTTIKAL